MALPKIDLPTYKLELKTSEKTITFRPFVVKEEKLLMMAMESEEFDTIMNTVKQIINNCVLDDLDVDALPLFELEHLFLNLRARSVGETIELSYICRNETDDRRCGAEMMVGVDLLKVDLDTPHVNPIIKITDSIGIKLKFPTVAISKTIAENSNDDDMEAAIKVIEHCTEYLFDADQTYKVDEMQPGEFVEFIENLTQDQFQMIKRFFDDLPTIKYSTTAKCPKCSKEHKIELEGLLDFFE